MVKVQVSNNLSLPEAIRRGQLEQVLKRIEEGEYGRIELTAEEYNLYRTDDDGFTSAFEYALHKKRWPIAMALLHAPEDYLEKGESPSNEKRAMAFVDLLCSLDEDRRDKPLPAKMRKQLLASWKEIDDNMQGEVGPSGEDGQAIFRSKCVFTQPRWLSMVPFMLENGVSPNLYTVTSEGFVSTLLRAAAMRGMEQEVKTLLDAGADPMFKMHDASLAAHAAADIENFRPDRELDTSRSVPSLENIKQRQACFELLNGLEGVSEFRNSRGKTPSDLWADGLAWLSKADTPENPEHAARYQARKLDMLTACASPSAPTRSRPRM